MCVCVCACVGGKHARTDCSRKISEFFRHQTGPHSTQRSSSPSSRPGSGNSSKGKGVEPSRDGRGQEVNRVARNVRTTEVQTTLTTSDLLELEGKASSSHLTAALEEVEMIT